MLPAVPLRDGTEAEPAAYVTEAVVAGLVARFDFAGAVLDLEQIKRLVEGWVQALGGLADHGRANNP